MRSNLAYQPNVIFARFHSAFSFACVRPSTNWRRIRDHTGFASCVVRNDDTESELGITESYLTLMITLRWLLSTEYVTAARFTDSNHIRTSVNYHV